MFVTSVLCLAVKGSLRWFSSFFSRLLKSHLRASGLETDLNVCSRRVNISLRKYRFVVVVVLKFILPFSDAVFSIKIVLDLRIS